MNDQICPNCKQETYYSYSYDANYCPNCKNWYEVTDANLNPFNHRVNIDLDVEGNYALVLDFQAKNKNFVGFKKHMDQLSNELTDEGYQICRYKFENRVDNNGTSYKPYHMEIVLHSSIEKKEAFRNMLVDMFQRFFVTNGIILNHYSFKDEFVTGQN